MFFFTVTKEGNQKVVYQKDCSRSTDVPVCWPPGIPLCSPSAKTTKGIYIGRILCKCTLDALSRVSLILLSHQLKIQYWINTGKYPDDNKRAKVKHSIKCHIHSKGKIQVTKCTNVYVQTNFNIQCFPECILFDCCVMCIVHPLHSTYIHMWGETNITYKHIIEPGCFGYRMIMLRKKINCNYKAFVTDPLKINKIQT